VVQGYTGPYKQEDLKIYLLGSPFVWWLNLLLLLLFPCYLLHRLFASRRAAAFNAVVEPLSKHVASAGWLYLGWCLHYLPFFLMSRDLYVHHYYPALVFSTCLSGVLVDLGVRRLAAKARLAVLVGGAALLIFTFRLFSPLVYGFRHRINDILERYVNGVIYTYFDHFLVYFLPGPSWRFLTLHSNPAHYFKDLLPTEQCFYTI
jgi:dolichyl-phosphate-mannose--protein O-mannosyl transferase